MDAVTDAATNETYSPDDFSQFCVCVCVCVSTPSREGVFLVVQSDWHHVRKGGAGSGKETAQLLQSTTDTGIHTHTNTPTQNLFGLTKTQNLHKHAIMLCIYFTYHLSAFKQITQITLTTAQTHKLHAHMFMSYFLKGATPCLLAVTFN